jgi:hypothetical protein
MSINNLFRNNATGELMALVAGCHKMGRLKKIPDLPAIVVVREIKSKQYMIYLAVDFYKTHSST